MRAINFDGASDFVATYRFDLLKRVEYCAHCACGNVFLNVSLSRVDISIYFSRLSFECSVGVLFYGKL